MIEDEALHLFITEEVFVVPEKNGTKETTAPQYDTPEPEKSTVAEPEIERPKKPHYPFAVITDEFKSGEADLLRKILAAVKQDLDKVHVAVNPASIEFDYDRLLVFGDFPFTELPSNQYEVQGTDTKIITSKTLSEVTVSKQEKSKLWEALKRWFAL